MTGKTIIPAIIDTHTHLAGTRDALVDQLRRLAYYGIAATLSLGQDAGDLPFQVRAETIPNAAQVPDGGPRHHDARAGPHRIPYWITTEAEARKAVQELAVRKVDIVKIWVDDRNGAYKKLTPALYGAIIDEAHKRPACASPPTSSRSRMRRGCCGPGSTASLTASATRTSTTSSWRCSSSGRTSS